MTTQQQQPHFDAQLIVLDIDNTVFDWVTYYVTAFSALLARLEQITGVPVAILAQEAQAVFTKHHSIEFPFLVQELPSVLAYVDHDIDRLLTECVEPARQAFNAAAQPYLKPYADVPATLAAMRQRLPGVPVVALTDAPRYVAMWKLNKLGILAYFDAVYGLSDPVIPTCEVKGRPKVDQEILMKHLQKSDFGFRGKIRILPEEYEKPGNKGLRMVLLDYDIQDKRIPHDKIVWVGDNLRKDVGLGLSLGVTTAWARYGTIIADRYREGLLSFSPVANVHKNVSLDPQGNASPKPHWVLDQFSDLLTRLFPA